ncbi:alternative ribosome rescue aminoacyl-tRNA hydrolase ArfB [Granulosicoccaceae sp. 1_MG-2023]|nr:alternative ribosome rescue aminoacyl-tRNA hydrolase ArfB [Granulosicoccaceae sp. 1_MG-2023]
MIRINDQIRLADHEVSISAIRAQGAGGQNVNKVSSAIHLRFDIRASSLPEHYKSRLLSRRDQRITDDGVVVIKAQSHRTREQNLADAYARLAALIDSAGKTEKKRRPTRPGKSAVRRRLDSKTRHGQKKAARGRIRPDD